MKNKIAIQMDDIKKIDFDFDSSFIIGFEGQRRNYDLFYYHPDDLFIDQGEVKAKGFFLELFDQKINYFKFLSDKTEVKLEEFKFIFLRQDPPFNMHYITSTFILDCLPESTKVINNPSSVRNAAEKILPFQFKEFMPPTLISQNVDEIKNFFRVHQDIITKPLYGNGGEGIHRSQDCLLEGIDIRCNYLEMPIMAQKFIPEISEGDRRIIFFDGDYVGSVARIPLEGSIKANFHAGGSAKKTGLVFRDQQIIEALGKEEKIGAIGLRLKKWTTYHGLSFNINPEIKYYEDISACGLDDYKNTSLKELGIKIDESTFDKEYSEIFLNKLKDLK